MTRGYRSTIYPEYPEEAPQLPQPHMDVDKQKLSHSHFHSTGSFLRRKEIPKDDNECGWEGNEVKVEDECDFGTHKHLYATTHNTFALMQSIVQMFRGFAQMVESTYMTTDSSFFAMGLFAMVRLFRGLITGQLVNDSVMHNEFSSYLDRPPGSPPPNPNAPKPSKKLLIFFLIALFGIPFLMHRIIRSLSARLPPPNHLPNEQVIDPRLR
ncbi:hypothetical protein BU17DRAFT_70863 [Hysterangium stoloniferum]|nr:hypothetical protein BU17DRAFT_70863 [Hysterangium stoloniferum]